MYTGSNLLPIGRFLAMSHDKQAFHSDNKEVMIYVMIYVRFLPPIPQID